jgi:hypothetical protein
MQAWAVTGSASSSSRHKQTIRGLDDRAAVLRQGYAHHRSTHDQTLFFRRLVSRLFQQVAHGRAQTHLEVTGFNRGLAGHRRDAADQRTTAADRVMHRNGSADVVAENADVRWQSPAGHLLAREYFDELFFTAGGILGREHNQLNICGRPCSACAGWQWLRACCPRHQRESPGARRCAPGSSMPAMISAALSRISKSSAVI